MEKLKTALTGSDQSRLEDLSMMTGKQAKAPLPPQKKIIIVTLWKSIFLLGFHHTGPLENLNSLGNKMANKAYKYRFGLAVTNIKKWNAFMI